MQLMTLGLNHESAPLTLRERLAFPGEALRDGLSELRATLKGLAPEQALLSTCNRTEMYLAVENPAEAQGQALDWLAWKSGTRGPDLSPHLYQLPNDQAVRHAFRVACGLDSMVLGEPQILGQMKLAAREAQEAGCLGTHLHHLFQQAFSVAKEVRTTTEIGLHSVSMAAAAVKLAQRIFGDLAQTKVLFIGAGEMIQLTATHFAAQHPKHIVVANRTLDRGQILAHEFGGEAIALAELPLRMHEFDIVVSCTASTLPIIGLGMIERAIKQRKHRPMFLVDLAVPRDIEREVAELDDAFLYTVDDLGELIKEGVQARQDAVLQAEAIIDHGVQSFIQWKESRQHVPVIKALSEHAEMVQAAEIALAKKRLAKGEDMESVLRSLAHGLSQKYLHGAYSQLHQMGHANPEEQGHKAELIRELFGLNKQRNH
ncbi:MAG: glutamyl-tRNA reductase [Burkholderiaceae bacterium]|nr:glutamyl-tRNA reductase [Burkholderiaceae bacterium]